MAVLEYFKDGQWYETPYGEYDIPTGGASEPLKLIYENTFTEVNSIKETVTGLQNCKEVYFELLVTKTEEVTIYYGGIGGVGLFYYNKMNCKSPYTEAYALGGFKKFGNNFKNTQAWRCVGNVGNKPTGTAGMSGTIAYSNGEYKYKDEFELSFTNAAVADVKIRIWGC